MLGKTEPINTTNAALGVGGSSGVTFIDSDGSLPSAGLDNDSGDLVFSRSTNSLFVCKGGYYRKLSSNSLVTAEMLLIAGGGGGQSGGGGAGGLLYYGSEHGAADSDVNYERTPNGSAINIDVGKTYTVTIGAGGARAQSGSNSTVTASGGISYTAIGGGGGANSGAGAKKSGFVGSDGG